MKLTVAQVKAAKPGAKTAKLYDGQGMYLEVTPKGSKRWRFRFRHRGKENTISLGLFPEVSLKAARSKREECRSLLAQGVSPSEARKQQKQLVDHQNANSFESVARRWFAAQGHRWADTYATRVISRLERDIFPWLGKSSVTEITAPRLLECLRRIEERGAVESAHRTLRTCGQVFRFGMASGLLDRDPTVGVREALSSVKKGHMAAIIEPARVGELLRMIDAFDGGLVVGSALRLAPLVFVRPGELRSAEWSEIDFDKAEWRFTTSKTGTEHIVPLARQSVEILRGVQPLTGRGRFVFPNARGRDRRMSDVALLAALRRLGVAKEEMTVHGFRAMARTLLDEELGFRPDFIEHQLAHAVRDPNGRAYNRTKFLDERREMMQRWADYLDTLRGTLEAPCAGEENCE